jgi:hypothetical protein
MDALNFLQAITGFTQSADPSGQKINKLAVVDPAYVDSSYPTVLPRVTFEGETTMSARTYPVISPYWPRRGDRVWMAPVGKGWVIVGGVEDAAPRLSIRSVTLARASATRNCNAVAQDITGASVVLTPKRAGGIWVAVWQADFQSIATGATTALVQLMANGVQSGTQAIWNPSNVAAGARVTAIGFASGSISSATADTTLKLQALRGAGADNVIQANTSHTGLLAVHLE